MAVMNRLTVVSRSALVPDGCLQARIALRATWHSAAPGSSGSGSQLVPSAASTPSRLSHALSSHRALAVTCREKFRDCGIG